MTGVAVVSHPSRGDMGNALAAVAVGTVVMDDDGVGCARNHVRALRSLVGHEWAVILEDDARPVPSFRAQVDAALAYAPGPLVCFYLGTGNNRQVQSEIEASIIRSRNAHAAWIRSDSFVSTVGYAVHRSIQGPLLDAVDSDLPDEVDELPARISRWAQAIDMPVHFTWPSLVDHRDGWSVIAGRNMSGRRAHHASPRADWNTAVASMAPMPGWSQAGQT